LQAGVQEDSIKAAQAYVSNLVATQRQSTCVQNPLASGCPATTTSTSVPFGATSTTGAH